MLAFIWNYIQMNSKILYSIPNYISKVNKFYKHYYSNWPVQWILSFTSLFVR